MTIDVDDMQGRIYSKFGMRIVYKEGYKNWNEPCIFTCSIHGNFEKIPKSLYLYGANCRGCSDKNLSLNSSFRKEDKTYGFGIFDLDFNLFDDPKRYKKIKNLWIDMLERCYSGREAFKAYGDCEVSENWFKASNFYNDLRSMDNYEKLHEGWHLDKDILFKGNRLYSAETCCIVPNEVNCIFNKAKGLRGKYPIGVCFDKEKDKFMASCHVDRKKRFLGYYDSEKLAFLAYKTYKEGVIKDKAVLHRKEVGDRVYFGMLNYKVDITD